MKIPDSFTPITAWRVWRLVYVSTDQPRLRSLYADDVWQPSQPKHTKCHRHCACTCPRCMVGLEGPHLYNLGDNEDDWSAACWCGIYGVKEVKIMYKVGLSGLRLNAFRGRVYNRYFVWGSIMLWGTVIEHEWGYRGEFGYPTSLFHTSNDVAYLCQLYGLELRNDSLEDVAS